MDDPLLGYLTLLSVTIIFVGTALINKKAPKKVFLLPILSMGIGFPIFLFLVIMQGAPYGLFLFYLALSLWNGGFFGLFYAWYLKANQKKKR